MNTALLLDEPEVIAGFDAAPVAVVAPVRPPRAVAPAPRREQLPSVVERNAKVRDGTFGVKLMEPRSLQFIAETCAGELRSGKSAALVTRVCTDSRQAQPGDLFFALSGDRFDGHTFVKDVAALGATAVVVDRAKGFWSLGGCAVIAVDNPRTALGLLAARHRREFELPVIAVGGSNGKTTTKELIAAVLRQKFIALWSEASFNNDIGVPLTLLKLERTHGAGVFEVGTNHPGELAPLVRMIQPQYGVVTSLGREHLEFFHDLAGVAQEEGWLAELLPASGKLFVNGDNPGMEQITRRARATIVSVGFERGNHWLAEDVRLDAQGTTFTAHAPNQKLSGEYRINLLGRHMVGNALLAMAVGEELGLSREQLQRALAGCTPPKMRLQVWETNGVCVLDDAYNANADSMRAALRTLHDLPCAGRRIAVLGDMAELGEQTTEAHIEVGRYAVEQGVQQLYAVGRMAGVVATAARAAGLQNVYEFADVADAGPVVKAAVRPGDVVLLKASRATRLERVGDALRGEPNATSN